ncbi:histidine phosphatase family protein [Candidatus Tisiphia endosymbiont of Micropterix aruncella]|uniref:histidine phosphatase family protein n=1 Tax=Candidatus Tisiphia endosymbiont of Micropterix aruncella TaxID=3066271 RepID=UPI003AA7B2FF
MKLPLKPFYFLRHGETDWNRHHIYMGVQDIPLNQTGENQAREASDILGEKDIKHIVTSPLMRAYRTAEIVNEKLKVDLTIVPELAECCWGEYEGQPIDDNILKRWLDGNPHQGAEYVNDFDKRVLRGLNSTLSFQEPVLIIAHSGVYRAIHRLLGGTIIYLKNCSPIFYSPPIGQSQSWSMCELS